MTNCRLNIWIKGKIVPQGKIYEKDGRWVYIANITDNKWWRNYSGYSISAQVLESFTKAKIKPRIIYNLFEKGILYETNKSTFYKKGILIPYGLHRQYCLPIQNWKVCREKLDEPFNLPDLDINQWLKPPVKMLHIDPEQKLNSMLRLKELFNSRVAHLNNP